MHTFLSSFQVKQHHHLIGEAPLTSPERLRPCLAQSEGGVREERREMRIKLERILTVDKEVIGWYYDTEET